MYIDTFLLGQRPSCPADKSQRKSGAQYHCEYLASMVICLYALTSTKELAPSNKIWCNYNTIQTTFIVKSPWRLFRDNNSNDD